MDAITQFLIDFVKQNPGWAAVIVILFGASELLGNMPKVKANSVFQIVSGALKAVWGAVKDNIGSQPPAQSK